TARAVQIAVENALRDRQLTDIRRLVSEMVTEHAQIDRIRIFNPALEVIAAEPPAPDGPATDRRLLEGAQTGQSEAMPEAPGTVLYVMPLRGRQGGIDGVVEIAFVSAPMQSRLRRASWDIALRIGSLTLALALLIGLVLQRQVLRPLSRLTASIRALGEG